MSTRTHFSARRKTSLHAAKLLALSTLPVTFVGATDLLASRPALAQSEAQNNAKESKANAKYAFVTVFPFIPPQEYAAGNKWLPAAYAMASQLSSELTSRGIPVRGGKGVIDILESEQILSLSQQTGAGSQFARKAGARYMIVGEVLGARTEIKNEYFLKLTRLLITVKADLIDTKTGIAVPGCSFTVEGLDSRRQYPFATGSGSVLDACFSSPQVSTDSPFAKAQADAAKKLAIQIAKHYPAFQEGDDMLDTGPRPASWDMEIEAASEAEALRKAVEKAVGALTDKPSDEQAAKLKEEVLAHAERYAGADRAGEAGGGIFRIHIWLSDPGGSRFALPRKLREMGLLRSLSAAILIPENVSGAETEGQTVQTLLQNRLAQAGFEVKDNEQLRKMRNTQYVEEMLKGSIDPAELQKLKDTLGVDLLVVGKSSASPVRLNANASGNGAVTMRGKVMVRVIDTSTAKILTTCDEIEGGREADEMLAATAAFKNVTTSLMSPLLSGIYSNMNVHPTEPLCRIVEMEISGWTRYSDAMTFLESLQKIEGVKGVVGEPRFAARILTAQIKVEKGAASKLGSWLESHPTLTRFGISVETSAPNIKASCEGGSPTSGAQTGMPALNHTTAQTTIAAASTQARPGSLQSVGSASTTVPGKASATPASKSGNTVKHGGKPGHQK